MSDDRPTLHITNWSSKALHGPGRKWTIMIAPRHWECGNGHIHHLRPDSQHLRWVQQGYMSPEEYETHFRMKLDALLPIGSLDPGSLHATETDQGPPPTLTPVRDGDSFLCACSKAQAAQGRCHRVWSAEYLDKAGWRVILDGKEFP